MYKPGCDEHYILHRLRKQPSFVPALSMVAEKDGQIVGHIAYTKTRIAHADGKETTALTFGPLSVLPKYQKQGIGAELVRRTLPLADAMEYPAVLILGHPDYYKRFGFQPATPYGLVTEGISAEDPAPFFMMRPHPSTDASALAGAVIFDPCFFVDAAETEVFDRNFPPKEKTLKADDTP